MSEMTQVEATEEALRLLVRKLRRLHPAVYAGLIIRLPDGAMEQLAAAEMRADNAFLKANAEGIERTWPAVFEAEDADED
jgi:hypothetical protein